MKIGARNQLKGTITGVNKGATTSHVKIDRRRQDRHRLHHQ
jgi:molybdopterin-binding protein